MKSKSISRYAVAWILVCLTASTGVSEQADVPAIPIEMTDLSTSPFTREDFDLDQIPDRLRQLVGKRVVIHGYMYPTFEEDGLTEFVISPETTGKSIHFAAGIEYFRIEHFITIRMKLGQTVKADLRKPFKVTGRIKLVPDAENGVLYSLFEITDATAIPVPPRKGFHALVGWAC